jgi:hypothetical protein
MTLLLDARGLGFDIVRGSQLIFKTLEKQGLRGEEIRLYDIANSTIPESTKSHL